MWREVEVVPVTRPRIRPPAVQEFLGDWEPAEMVAAAGAARRNEVPPNMTQFRCLRLTPPLCKARGGATPYRMVEQVIKKIHLSLLNQPISTISKWTRVPCDFPLDLIINTEIYWLCSTKNKIRYKFRMSTSFRIFFCKFKERSIASRNGFLSQYLLF